MAPYAGGPYAQKVQEIFESYLQVDGLEFRRRVPDRTGLIGARLLKDLRFQRFDAIAAGLQNFTEAMLLQWVRNAIAHTGIHRLCLSGGTFMNVKGGGVLRSGSAADRWVAWSLVSITVSGSRSSTDELVGTPASAVPGGVPGSNQSRSAAPTSVATSRSRKPSRFAGARMGSGLKRSLVAGAVSEHLGFRTPKRRPTVPAR
jgi:hypothetical protein